MTATVVATIASLPVLLTALLTWRTSRDPYHTLLKASEVRKNLPEHLQGAWDPHLRMLMYTHTNHSAQYRDLGIKAFVTMTIAYFSAWALLLTGLLSVGILGLFPPARISVSAVLLGAAAVTYFGGGALSARVLWERKKLVDSWGL